MTKVAIVTGANKGIGYSIVDGLRKQFDGIIYLTSRNEERGVAAWKQMGSPSNVQWMQLDVSDTKNIDEFHSNFMKKHPEGLDILVNNAGIAYKQNSTAPVSEQAEVTMKTNYFGLKYLTMKFINDMKKNGHVVNVASQLGLLTRIPSKNLKEKFADKNTTIDMISGMMEDYVEATKKGKQEELGWGSSSYGISKTGVIAFTKALYRSQKNNGKNIFISACCPGYVKTDMSSQNGFLSTEEGAATPVFLSTIPKYDDSNNGTFWYLKEICDWENKQFSFK
ncbi:hypothetical protein SNEBB_002157 [Seison nebaliae]|nr:hypothetical protein SNEBB_002157 [Seison nebaliae]